MDDALNKLKLLLAEISDLSGAQAVLGWDQQTYMPPGGMVDRGNQLATLARLAHQKFTSEEVGRLLEDINNQVSQLDPDSDEARLIKVVQHDYQKFTRVPTEWVAEFTQVTSMAQSVWEKAKANNDFTLFQPHLEKIIDLRQQYANFFSPYDHIYDPLLDDFEPGLKTADVQEIFDGLRPRQVALIKEVMDHQQVDDSFLKQSFPEQPQWEFGVEVITSFGFDWQHGRQDRSAHPFTTTFGIDDVRITTRFNRNGGISALFSTMHECGHALYELGVDPALRRTPLADGASMAIHESQSRLWENLVGRSLPFWRYNFPRMKQMFPSELSNVDLERFYKGINKVEPSLIRVESDEATYNLHIMLRMELEIGLLEGDLVVRDLPEAWNTRMKEYLGLTPPDDSSGVLQDVHWSGGMIGYFPTYALGNLISVQFWECIQKDIPDLDEQIQRGEFNPLLEWLREKIHRHGAKFQPQELVKKVTGSTIDPDPYLRYLKKKYSEIYK